MDLPQQYNDMNLNNKLRFRIPYPQDTSYFFERSMPEDILLKKNF